MGTAGHEGHVHRIPQEATVSPHPWDGAGGESCSGTHAVRVPPAPYGTGIGAGDGWSPTRRASPTLEVVVYLSQRTRNLKAIRVCSFGLIQTLSFWEMEIQSEVGFF